MVWVSADLRAGAGGDAIKKNLPSNGRLLLFDLLLLLLVHHHLLFVLVRVGRGDAFGPAANQRRAALASTRRSQESRPEKRLAATDDGPFPWKPIHSIHCH